jgi:hypothetical protein
MRCCGIALEYQSVLMWVYLSDQVRHVDSTILLQEAFETCFQRQNGHTPQRHNERNEGSTDEGSGEASRFQFVGGASINEGDAYLRRRVRQHVMRDYMQKARALGAWVDPQRALERWKASRPLFTPPRALGSPSTRAVDLASKSGDNSNSLGLAQNAGFGPSAGTPTDFTRLLPEGTSIQTFLEIGRMDPFAAYPIEFSSVEYQILDFR